MKPKSVILTGGAGYIGSHIAVLLIEAGYEVVIIDDFSNSSPSVIDRIEKLSSHRPQLIEQDLSVPDCVDSICSALAGRDYAGVIHLAGLKAVGESVEQPGRYYKVNLGATLNLLTIMEKLKCKSIVFSSSATVYGELNPSPVDEAGKTGPTNPYGFSKLFNEQILSDYAAANAGFQVINLRYFNPVGAHPSGLIGEDPKGIPNNLFPYIAQVAVGRRVALNVFGDDYDTIDGTGVRDYIHVMDLAEGHLAALRFGLSGNWDGVECFNLGCGCGFSVLEVVDAFATASGQKVPVKVVKRRAGDIAEIVADAARAEKLLGWKTQKDLNQMCADHWYWQEKNPDGFG
jgi:UDP-glucose 4-epimerase